MSWSFVRRTSMQMLNLRAICLQSIFEEADDDDDPGLDMEEFRVAMRKAMGPHLTDDEIDTIFMKVVLCVPCICELKKITLSYMYHYQNTK